MSSEVQPIRVHVREAYTNVGILQELPVTDVFIFSAINNIPNANITISPKSREQAASIISTADNIFKPYSIIGSDWINNAWVYTVLFSGYYAGTQSTFSSSGFSLGMNLYGGMYKLSQMTSFCAGIHGMANDVNYRAATTTGTLISDIAKGIHGKNMVDILSTILSQTYSYILDTFERYSGDIKSTSTRTALQSLITFNSKSIGDLIQQELGKVKSIGADPTIFDSDTIRSSVQMVINSVIANPAASLWDVLVKILQCLGLQIGYQGEQSYIFPLNPFGKPARTIIPENIKSIAVDPFPLNIPTRCYMTLDQSAPYNKVLETSASSATYPILDKLSEPTALEKKLGTLRTLVYTYPGLIIDRNNFEDSAEFLSKYAQSYLLSETLKYRNATLELAFSPTLLVGQVVSFADPFFDGTYQGYVTQVTHRIGQGSTGTSIHMQYIVSEKEKEDFGFTTFNNYLYPEFTGV